MKIKIYADNTYRATDSNSLIALTSLPAYTDENWKEYEILGLEPFSVDLDEPVTTPKGGTIESTRTIWEFRITFMPLYGLDNHIGYFTLQKQLKKPHKYFVLSDYSTVLESEFSATGKAVAFKVTEKIVRPDADFEKGKKQMVVTVRKVKANA